MIVATAGHIDHGKTTLIRALTGVDTDTLPEERARGISIDLGFAHWGADADHIIGFIDVPGHERFVRNMLAGVSGIDLALLVVAADDGPMPQTLEHIHILDLLGVPAAIVVVTKQDRVAPERVAEVMGQVRTLLEPTGLAVEATCAVSATTGQGIGALQDLLRTAAAAHRPPSGTGRNFRMAIDRVFTVAGRGTVVTGTVAAGTVANGATLVVSPAGSEVRVRGIQRGGVPVEGAGAGQRCALNVAGPGSMVPRRGDWIVAPAAHVPTTRIEVRLALLAGEARPLAHLTRVHLHVGTFSGIAHVHLPQRRALAPGATADAMLVLQQPVCVSHGDRFVLRDQGAVRTIGGGRVLNPLPGALRSAGVARDVLAQALSARDPEQAIGALLDAATGEIDVDALAKVFNLEPAALTAVLAKSQAEVFGAPRKVVMRADKLRALRDAVLAEVAELHKVEPQARGAAPRALRTALAPALRSETFLALLRGLAEERRITFNGALVGLPGHTVAMRPADTVLWQRVLPRLVDGGATPPLLAQVAQDLQVKEVVLEDLLNRKRAEGEVWRVAKNRFYPRPMVATLAATAAACDAASGRPGFTAAAFRDAIGTGRTLAIQILEFFDSIGVTRRVAENNRRMLPDYQLLVGTGAPLSVTEKR